MVFYHKIFIKENISVLTMTRELSTLVKYLFYGYIGLAGINFILHGSAYLLGNREQSKAFSNYSYDQFVQWHIYKTKHLEQIKNLEFLIPFEFYFSSSEITDKTLKYHHPHPEHDINHIDENRAVEV